MKVLLCIVIFGVSFVGAQNTILGDCGPIKGGKYKLGFSSPVGHRPKEIYLQISIKKENFNREYMLDVVKRIRSEYCHFDRFTVVIFDNLKEAKDPGRSMVALINSNQTIFLMRGYYILDRTTGKEQIEFSLEPGKPTSQVGIQLKGGLPVP